MQEMKLQVIIL
jgi:hypothetical protein